MINLIDKILAYDSTRGRKELETVNDIPDGRTQSKDGDVSGVDRTPSDDNNDKDDYIH